MVIYKKHLTITLPLALLGIVTLMSINVQARYVLAPGIACVLIVIGLLVSLWQRDRQLPFFDIGMLCVSMTCVYSVYPLVNFMFGDFSFGTLGDGRLTHYGPSPSEIGLFHFRHVVYLLFLGIFYSVSRGRKVISISGKVAKPSHRTQQIIILGFVLLNIYFSILNVATGINFNHGYDPDSVANNLAVNASAPLILLQLSGKLAGLEFIFQTAVITLIILRCNQRKWLVGLIILIFIVTIQSFLEKGSRGGLMAFMLLTLLMYHRVHRVSLRFLFGSISILFLYFMFMGWYRAFDDFTSWQGAFDNFSVVMSAGNEFQSLLGTAYDVYLRKLSGIELPWYLAINDFTPILPPQQLLPFEKVTGAEWYLREIGISGTGQGFMWGVITQAIVGFDWIELALRGALLGYILARIHRWYQERQEGFLETLFYSILCVYVLGTFRDTTGAIFWPIFWEFIPFYIVLRLLGGPKIRHRSRIREVREVCVDANVVN